MSLESNVADAIKRKGIGLAELSRKTGISYMKLYDSFSNANRARPLRGSELIAMQDPDAVTQDPIKPQFEPATPEQMHTIHYYSFLKNIDLSVTI